jgi:16S rRNA (cytidine1402-2'-O)-methyltransferase
MYVSRKETLIIYESPNRVKKTLSYMLDILGNRKVSVARELTKKFETYYRGYIKDILETTLDTRGEYVIVVEGSTTSDVKIEDPVELVLSYMKQGYDEKEAIKLASKDLGVHKSEVYKIFKIDKNN